MLITKSEGSFGESDLLGKGRVSAEAHCEGRICSPLSCLDLNRAFG